MSVVRGISSVHSAIVVYVQVCPSVRVRLVHLCTFSRAIFFLRNSPLEQVPSPEQAPTSS